MTHPPLDLDAIESAAKKATPGPWRRSNGGSGVLADYPTASEWVCRVQRVTLTDDASFIASASPDRVLQLCAWIRELQSEVAQLKMDLNEARTDPAEHVRSILPAPKGTP